ncbi:hypothetical protein SERLADRAFT_389800, partial [Serpula lacrymans var. lacrymans S7.9]
MLSHRKIGTFPLVVPINTIIFDEASQIEVGDYLPMLNRYHTTLGKLVFIGDHRQLAPYGQDDVGNLQSIFDFPHMHNKAIFLGIQYRMPHVIGEFISRHVYDRRLQTQHSITSRSACRFVDVLNGKEEKSGKSWVNRKEAGIVVNICRIYEKQSKAFRVITPYDAQRSLIEKELESAKLKWENKCFNVDSFQGNEDEHIIISLVRSEGVGFLKN